MAQKSFIEEILGELRTYRVWIGLGIFIVMGTLVLGRMSFYPVTMPDIHFGFGYLTLGILLIVFSFVVKAGTWIVLLRPLGKTGFFSPFSSILIGHLIDNAFGTRLGELIRAGALGLMEKVSILSALVTVFLYRLIDGTAILLFVLLVSGFVKLPAGLLQMSALGFISALFVLGILVFARRRKGPLSLPVLMSLQPKGSWLRKRANEVIQGLNSLESWKDILLVFALSLITRLAVAGYYWTIGKAFGLTLPPHSPLALMGLLYFRRFIPTPAFSSYEGTVLEYLGMGEASKGILEAYAIISYTDMYLITSALGLFILLITSFRRLKGASVAIFENRMIRSRLHPVWMAIWVFTLGESFYQGYSYVQDQSFVNQKAMEITVGLKTDGEKIDALVTYLKTHVHQDPLPIFNIDRPFLRYDARDVLLSGNAFCGEGVRTFIKLLSPLGIQARRVNLYGMSPHVVAEVLVRGRWVIIDPQKNVVPWPKKKGWMTLREIIDTQFYGWDDYSTLNLRRLGLSTFMGSPTQIKVPLPRMLSWLLESPHLIKLCAFLSLFCLSLAGWFLQRRFFRR